MSGEISGAENSLLGDTPGFADAAHDDFHLAPNSPCSATPAGFTGNPVRASREKSARHGAFGAP